MLNLFRTGKVFFFLAGLSFLLAALKYFLSGDEYATFSGSLLATGFIWLVVGLPLRQKYTKETQGG
jgi:hypothetical protein